MTSGPGTHKPDRGAWRQAVMPQPPGGASASGLMRLSGIGQFDQGTPRPGPGGWGTPLDPTHGPTPGWDPGEVWPPRYTHGDEYIPSTQHPGQYVTGTGDISVGIQPSSAAAPGSIPLQRFPSGGEDLYSVQPNLSPQFELPPIQQVSNYGPVGDFINRVLPQEIA